MYVHVSESECYVQVCMCVGGGGVDERCGCHVCMCV